MGKNSYSTGENCQFQFAIVGGGAGGLSVASTLGRRFGRSKVAVIEPAQVSLYSSSRSTVCHRIFYVARI